jgi:steroid Delta-isomerase
MGDTRRVDAGAEPFLAEHVRRFNAAVDSGDFKPLVELFADDAELSFVGVPVGPFVGREAIEAAYAAQPPGDQLDVTSVADEGEGTYAERFAWRGGGTGTMRVALRDGRIARLEVAFD